MRVGTSLRDKAILALEEAVQECRYGPLRRSHAHRFALAYLWSLGRGDRQQFLELWQALASDNDVYRFGKADRALSVICRQLGAVRDDAISFHFWEEAQRRLGSGKPPAPNCGNAQDASANSSQ